jgi:hypothetical protein
VEPPPSPLVHEFLPKTTPADNIQLNIDVVSMFGKLNMAIPMIEMCKIPSMKREIMKLLHVTNMKEYPPIILNTMYLDQPRDMNSPFYL